MNEPKVYHCNEWHNEYTEFYMKSEADKVFAEKDAEICRLKNGIAPKQSDKTLQERLNEVCEKHGVSTLQDLDWAFCESEKRRTRDSIESANMIAELKEKLDLYKRGWAENDKIIAYLWAELKYNKHKRCLAMADACRGNFLVAEHMIEKEPKNLMWHKRHKHYGRWMMLWRCFAEEFKETK